MDRPIISCNQHDWLIFKSYWDLQSIELKEEMMMLLLNRANRVLGIFTISSGGVFLFLLFVVGGNTINIVVSTIYPRNIYRV